MSGLIAIKGFDYQATVILDRLFEHFDARGDTARARPEGIDDLDLTWIDPNGSSHSRYVQVKKPREDVDGNRKPRPWSIQEVIDELLPNTISHLSGNSSEQIWILGDAVETDVQSLIAAGSNAPTHASSAYFKIVHILARNHAFDSPKLDQNARKDIIRWKISNDLLTDPSSAFAKVTDTFANLIERVAPADVKTLYRDKAQSVHNDLPDVLSRISVECLYGSEEAVTQRVRDKLVNRFGLDPSVVERTIFRNLRGFINDISKQAGRRFDREEFDLELRCVWPHMLLVKEPPPLPSDHLARTDITDLLTKAWSGRAIEVLGVSGSGKTTLASETILRSLASEPQRIPLYIEVTKTARLRDALAGVGFHLRRFGFHNLFAIATDSRGTNEETLEKLGRVFAAAAQNLLLVFDLVEGTCNDAFARDLAKFVLNLSSTECHLIVMGQECALRGLSALERYSNGVNQFDIHGFNSEDFFRLVSLRYPDPDRKQLWSIYNKVTAGKSAGLLPALAKALVAAPSLAAMAEIAAQPAEDMLQYAEREKFARVSAGARGGAERLVCFALAFSRADAESCFPSDNIGMAIREMTELGLLRANADQTFEMHEIVRAGLEGLLSPEGRRSTHAALAAWYQGRGLLTAEVFHLEKSGDLHKAKARARDAFLSGHDWDALAAWVIRHQAVSDAEVLAVMASTTLVNSRYVFSGLLRHLGQSINVDQLIAILRAQPDRVIKEYQWGSAMFTAALEMAPQTLTDLVAFALQSYPDMQNLEHALSMLLISARRVHALTNASILGFFQTANVEIRRALLPLMLFESRRDNLAAAFAFLNSSDFPSDNRSKPAAHGISLKVNSRVDAVEIMHALPEVKPHLMLVAKSPLLGALASLFWLQRRQLQKFCAEILRSDVSDAKVLNNAIRILIFVMDPAVCDICDELAVNGSEELRGFAMLMPSLVPTLIDKEKYKSRLFDAALSIPTRASALAVLAAVGADMSFLYNGIKASEGNMPGMQLWDFFFLQVSPQAPFPEAIELLRRQLASANGASSNVFTGALQSLGGLPTADAAALLIEMVSHADRTVRLAATQALGARRSKASLSALAAQFVRETDPLVAVQIAVAMIASGADSTNSLDHPGLRDPTLLLWQCILANRLGDAGFARQIIDTANDSSLHWELRRAAIAAAGKLPFESAMKEILPVVMAERSPLTIDRHQGLACHSALSWLLLNEAQAVVGTLNRGKQRFSEFWAEVIEGLMQGDMWPDGIPTGRDAADWLFDRLVHHGSPANGNAPDQIIGELHVPLLQSAVLRSLRQTKRPDLIDVELSQASTLWLAIKCLLQRGLTKDRDTDFKERLRALVASSPHRDEQILKNIIEEFGGAEGNASCHAQPSSDKPKPSSARTILGYEDVRRMLEGDVDCAPPDQSSPRILDNVTLEQFERLVLLADPANDRYKTTQKYVPQMSFTEDSHSVARMQSTSTAQSEPAGAMLRPMIAAANPFGADIPWHETSLNGMFASTYISRFVTALNAQDSSARFYDEIFAYPDLLLPELGKAAIPVNHKHVDARIAPLIAMYAGSGTDEFFETLCTIAGSVHSPEIDPALAALFNRWVQSFDLRSPIPQHTTDYQLWRGFRLLTSHQRFNLIEDWQGRLSHVMRCSLAWYHKQDIARVLERHLSSYIQIEAALSKQEDWGHFRVDEIGRLEEAADRLFRQSTAEFVQSAS